MPLSLKCSPRIGLSFKADTGLKTPRHIQQPMTTTNHIFNQDLEKCKLFINDI